jgi:chemotaxis protein MotB
MKQKLGLFFIAIFLVAPAGCAELKQLRIETADQKATIAQLTQENQTCQADLKKTNDMLVQKVKDLENRMNELKTKEEKVKEQSDAYAKMQEAMKSELASKQVAIKELEGKLTLTLVESILFDSGKAVVKQEGVDALQKVADVLKNTKDQEIVVAGYTDNVPIKGTLVKVYPTNWELSAARAISVVKILTTDGVDPKLMSAAGYGEYRPIAENDTPEGRAKNRRMEIVLMPKRK